MMKVAATGMILNTERYDACVSFYAGLFGFPVLFTKEEGNFRLTCFDLGGSYLMVETGGVAGELPKSMSESTAKLRIHVEDIEAALQEVRAYGIDAEISRFDWGATINIHDPDGNRIGIRDHAGYMAQVVEGL